MRIAWFSPLSDRSAIGEFSAHVTAALAEHAEVELWTADAPPYHAVSVPVVTYDVDKMPDDRLRGADVAIYNMGDYLPFHGSISEVSVRHPGIVILHDRVLHHLYAGMWLSGPSPEPETYVERMGRYYGEAGGDIARASLDGDRSPVWESDDEALRFPLSEEATRLAIGVVTHAAAHARDVQGRVLGPVASLFVPCYRDVFDRAEEAIAAQSPLGHGDKVNLLTFGHINPNKQAHRVIAMLAADPTLAARVRYLIVGPDDGFKGYVRELRDLARRTTAVDVEVRGWCSDDSLHELMVDADVFVNLRHPVMEGGSASLMRQLAYGRPVLSFADGFVAELPDDVVEQVPRGDFGEAAVALRRLVDDAERRMQLGRRAREVAGSYSEGRYAEGLMNLIERSRAATPAMKALDSVAQVLGEMRASRRMLIFDEIASDFARILEF